jgi:GAF domain-containing protein
VWRFDAQKTTGTVIAAWSEDPQPWQPGTRWPIDGRALAVEMLRTGRPARIDDYTELPGTIAVASRDTGLRGAAGAPIVVDGDMWGWMAAASSRAALPDHIEDRLAEFTELVATAISGIESRDQLARLAEEQAALRRVATLVARGVAPAEVFAAVAHEVAMLLSADFAATSPTARLRSSPAKGTWFASAAGGLLRDRGTSPLSCWRRADRPGSTTTPRQRDRSPRAFARRASARRSGRRSSSRAASGA